MLVSLGQTTLRADAVGLVAVSIVSFMYESWLRENQRLTF